MNKWRAPLTLLTVVAAALIGYMILGKAGRPGEVRDLILINNSLEDLEVRIDGVLLGESHSKSLSRWPRALSGDNEVLEVSSASEGLTAIPLANGIELEGNALVVAIPPVI